MGVRLAFMLRRFPKHSSKTSSPGNDAVTEELEQLFSTPDPVPDVMSLFRKLRRVARRSGFEYSYYMLHVLPGATTQPQAAALTDIYPHIVGLDTDMLAQLDLDAADVLVICDQLSAEVMRVGEPLRLSEFKNIVAVDKVLRDSDVAARFMRLLGEGMVLPLYGSGGRSACVLLATGKKRWAIDGHDIFQAWSLASWLHIKICAWMRTIAPAPHLSPREREIISNIAKGLSNFEVARELGISPNTVATHIRRVFLKLNVHDRVSLTLRAISLGIV